MIQEYNKYHQEINNDHVHTVEQQNANKRLLEMISNLNNHLIYISFISQVGCFFLPEHNQTVAIK